MMNINEVRAKVNEIKAQKVNTTNMKGLDRVFVKPSEKQIATYLKLCKEKGQKVDMSYRTWDGSRSGKLSKEISRMLIMPSLKLISEGQIGVIKDICERNDWELPSNLYSMEGGRDGEASQFIQELMNLERDMQHTQPPTDKQVQTILEMYYCPSIQFGDLHEQYDIVYAEGSNKTYWSRASQEAILASIYEITTYGECADFIAKYQIDFYDWNRTRCTEAQMIKIRAIQERAGMQPMENYALLQFDKLNADKYLKNMAYAMRDRELQIQDQAIQTLRDNFVADMEAGVRVTTLEKAEEVFRQKLDDAMYNMYAMLGLSAKEDSDECVDLTNTMSVIGDLWLLVIELNGESGVNNMMEEMFGTDLSQKIFNNTVDVTQDLGFKVNTEPELNIFAKQKLDDATRGTCTSPKSQFNVKVKSPRVVELEGLKRNELIMEAIKLNITIPTMVDEQELIGLIVEVESK